MKLFNIINTEKKNYILETKYFTKLQGAPKCWKKVRKSIWTTCSCDKKDAAWMSFFAKFVGAVVEIAITPIGILLWVANNTKHAVLIDKKNHDEGHKSSQAWPWITLCACMAFGLVLVQDYRSGGEITRITQAVVDNTVDQLTVNPDDDKDGTTQVRFREFGGSGNDSDTRNNEKRFVTDETAVTTTEVTTEATTEATEAATKYEPGVPDEDGIYHIPESEYVDETQQIPAETVVVNNDGDTYQLDEDGEIIWDEESWNCYPEEEEIVYRGAVKFE